MESYESLQFLNRSKLDNTWSDPLLEEHTSSASFGYDSLDRLASAANGFGTLSFGYDPTGNRVQQILNGETTQYTYLPYDKLAASGQNTLTYDVNRNTLSKVSSTDVWSYQYDAENRLTEVQHNGQTLGTYMYNGVVRGSRRQNGTRTHSNMRPSYTYALKERSTTKRI